MLSQILSSALIVFFYFITLGVFAFLYKTRLLYIPKEIQWLLLISFPAIIIGLLNSLVEDKFDWYYFFRDFFYFLQPVIIVFFGIYLARLNGSNNDYFAKSLVISIFFICMYGFLGFFMNPEIVFNLGLESRYSTTIGNVDALFGLLILFNYPNKLFSGVVTFVLYVVFFVSLILTFSRTYYVVLLFLVFVPYVNLRYKNIISMMFLLYVFVNLFIGSVFEVKAADFSDATFISKLSQSFYEILIRDFDYLDEINSNWRGYEAFLGIKKYLSGGVVNIFFGHGFGSYAETPKWVFNGEMEQLDILPLFHNGYISILLKSGVWGVFLYCALLVRLVSSCAESKNAYMKFNSIVLSFLGFYFMLTTQVTHGIFKFPVAIVPLLMFGFYLYEVSKQTE